MIIKSSTEVRQEELNDNKLCRKKLIKNNDLRFLKTSENNMKSNHQRCADLQTSTVSRLGVVSSLSRDGAGYRR
jgi:hypothetical protein